MTHQQIDQRWDHSDDSAELLDKLNAVYCLEIQKHHLLIEQLKNGSTATGNSTSAPNILKPDFLIRPRRAA